MSTTHLLRDLLGPDNDYAHIVWVIEARTAPPPEKLWLSTVEAAEQLGINRKPLDHLAHANLDLPGGPVVGGGRKRLHLRWPPKGLETWHAAMRALSNPARPALPEPARRSRPPTPVTAEGVTNWSDVRRRLLGKVT
jgi:hypothetical protein